MLNKILSMKSLGTFVKNAGCYFFSSLFVAIVGVVCNPIFSMYLSHEDYAILGYFSSFNLLLVPMLHYSLFQYYARQYYFTPEDKRDDLGNTILLASTILGTIVLILFLCVFYFIYNSRSNISFPFYPYAQLTFIQLLIGNIITFYKIQLRIQRKAKRFAIVSILYCVMTTAFSLILVVIYREGAVGKLIGALFATILFAVYAFRHALTKIYIDRQILRESIRFCTPLTISALFWYCLSGIDRLYLEPLSDNINLGLYNIGISIAGYLTIFHTTISSTFEPDIYQAISKNDVKKIILYFSIIIGSVIFFNILFIVLAPYIIGILTANRYIDSCSYARILAIHNITMSLYYLVVNLLVGFGYTKLELYVRVIGSIISACMFYILIKYWGYYGAAWGQVLSFLLLSLLGLTTLLYQKKIEKNKKN